MSVVGRLNHRASIYRPLGTVDRLGDVVVRPRPTGEPTYENVRCYLYSPRITDTEDRGPGNQRIGHDKMMFKSNQDVDFNDIVVITKGPNVGKKYKVTNVQNVMDRHKEVTVDVYYGP